MNYHEQSTELIPIMNRDGERAVSGRSLHEFLEVTTRYNDWMPRMLEYGFAEGQDFYSILSESTGGRPSTDHALSMDMAKELSMIQRTERGKQARQYFIAVEKRATQVEPQFQIPQNYADALRAHAREVEAREAMEAYARELEPKAEAYEAFLDGDGTYSVGNVAKMIGLSQNKLYDRLRNEGVMIAKGAMRNTPYQKYMHHFRVTPYNFTRSDGTTGTSYTTRVQPSGVDFIRRKLGVVVAEVAA